MSQEDTILTWKSSPRQIIRAMLSLADSPHHIALGTAIGMFIGLTPTVGIQMILVVVFAGMTRRYFHFNRIAALLTVYVSNPVTMVPLYYALYWVGALFVPGSVTMDDFRAILEYEDFAGWWSTIVNLFVGIGAPLLIGTSIVATLGGLITYPLMLRAVTSYRRRADAFRHRKAAMGLPSKDPQLTDPQPSDSQLANSPLIDLHETGSQQTAPQQTAPHETAPHETAPQQSDPQPTPPASDHVPRSQN